MSSFTQLNHLCHLLCYYKSNTPFTSPNPHPISISCSPASAEQSTIMKSIDEEGQRTQQGGDVAEAEDAGNGRVAETLLRVAPIGLCLAALIIMVKNSQDGDYGSISYSDLAAFKYLVYANGACAAYSLLSAFFVAIPRPTTLSRSWTVFLLDQLLTYIILAAGTVSTEILYLAYKGNENVTWSKSCGMFDTFCRRATTSVGITFGSVVCYVLLSLISSYRLFSGFEAPIPFLSSKSPEIAAFPS
ncbi:CASP-like protein 2A1 [Curcuma longa]|uniref:CASP-like protein 2A1 n=1 Tax=Curcuma longa TaxID=136217 RepID=UPI003D9E5362